MKYLIVAVVMLLAVASNGQDFTSDEAMFYNLRQDSLAGVRIEQAGSEMNTSGALKALGLVAVIGGAIASQNVEVSDTQVGNTVPTLLMAIGGGFFVASIVLDIDAGSKLSKAGRRLQKKKKAIAARQNQ